MTQERHRDADSAEATRDLIFVWIGLLLCLAATACVELLPWKSIHPAINIGISFAKMLLIGFFFMHLKNASTLSRLIAVGGFLWLALLMGLSFTDFATRAVTPLR